MSEIEKTCETCKYFVRSGESEPCKSCELTNWETEECDEGKIAKKEYTWNFNSDAEIWDNNLCETIGDCINEAKMTIAEGTHGYAEPPTVVYIGESVPFTISVDSETVLDALEQQADEFCGEAAERWNAYDHKKHDEVNELDEKLSAVVSEWMKKYDYKPCFYVIENIKECSLEEELKWAESHIDRTFDEALDAVKRKDTK